MLIARHPIGHQRALGMERWGRELGWLGGQLGQPEVEQSIQLKVAAQSQESEPQEAKLEMVLR